MVTGIKRGDSSMPWKAIQCFENQTWPDRELLIINHGTVFYCGDGIRNVPIHKTDDLHCGGMRNLAFVLASGDWLMTWDDDDIYSPERMAVQASAIKKDSIIMLKNRIVVDVLSGQRGIRSSSGGGMSSMLYPKNTPHRFLNLKNGSDVLFADCFENRFVIDNDPSLYIRTWHGENLTDRAEVMRDLKPE
jgi:hypothetical protein